MLTEASVLEGPVRFNNILSQCDLQNNAFEYNSYCKKCNNYCESNSLEISHILWEGHFEQILHRFQWVVRGGISAGVTEQRCERTPPTHTHFPGVCPQQGNRQFQHQTFATWTQTQRNLEIWANDWWGCGKFSPFDWLSQLGNVGFEFTLQIPFGAETVYWVMACLQHFFPWSLADKGSFPGEICRDFYFGRSGFVIVFSMSVQIHTCQPTRLQMFCVNKTSFLTQLNLLF